MHQVSILSSFPVSRNEKFNENHLLITRGARDEG
jgi:hypothetical protein